MNKMVGIATLIAVMAMIKSQLLRQACDCCVLDLYQLHLLHAQTSHHHFTLNNGIFQIN